MSSIEIVGAGVITIFAMVNPRGVLEELSGLGVEDIFHARANEVSVGPQPD